MSIKRNAFSLVELAVVLIIISLLMGAGISMSRGALQAADRIATQEKLNTIKMALDSFAKTYGHLPCPADRTLTMDASLFGVENRNNYSVGNVCGTAGIVNVAVAYIGTVPVRTLGLPDNYDIDAWGNKLTYAVSLLMVSDPTSYSTKATGVTVRYGQQASYNVITTARGTINFTSVTSNGGNARFVMATTGAIAVGTMIHVDGTSTNLYNGSYRVINVEPDVAVTVGVAAIGTDAGVIEYLNPGGGASYVVISHGRDGRGAIAADAAIPNGNKLCIGSATGNSSPPPCTSSSVTSCIDINNCDNNDAIFTDAPFNNGTNPVAYFDDFIVYGSNMLARNPVNKGLYTNSTTSSCPPGVCEAWCAACTINYPGGSPAIPPAGIASDPILCRKVITGTAATCAATCFWSGTTPTGYEPCL